MSNHFVRNLPAMKSLANQLKEYHERVSGPGVYKYHDALTDMREILVKHIFRTDMVEIAESVRKLAFMTSQAIMGDVLRKDVAKNLKDLIATIEAIEE